MKCCVPARLSAWRKPPTEHGDQRTHGGNRAKETSAKKFPLAPLRTPSQPRRRSLPQQPRHLPPHFLPPQRAVPRLLRSCHCCRPAPSSCRCMEGITERKRVMQPVLTSLQSALLDGQQRALPCGSRCCASRAAAAAAECNSCSRQQGALHPACTAVQTTREQLLTHSRHRHSKRPCTCGTRSEQLRTCTAPPPSWPPPPAAPSSA